jgi:hypothetical protein
MKNILVHHDQIVIKKRKIDREASELQSREYQEWAQGVVRWWQQEQEREQMQENQERE